MRLNVISDCWVRLPRRGSGWGFTLIEIAVVLAFVSVVVALVLNGSGGIPGSRGNGTSNYPTVSSASKYMTQRYLASSSLLESAMSGRIIGYNTDNSQVKVLPPPGEGEEEGTPGMDYDKDMLFEIDPATPITTARAAYDEDGHTYFDWEIRDCSYTYDEYNDEYTFAVPEGNRLLCLTLRVYESQTATTPWRTFQAKIFVNDFDPETWVVTDKVGVAFVIDTSDTMRQAKTLSLPLVQGVAPPYLRYLQTDYPSAVDITLLRGDGYPKPNVAPMNSGPKLPYGHTRGRNRSMYPRRS